MIKSRNSAKAIHVLSNSLFKNLQDLKVGKISKCGWHILVPKLHETKWSCKRAGSEKGPVYFHSLLPVKWELILHGSELPR